MNLSTELEDSALPVSVRYRRTTPSFARRIGEGLNGLQDHWVSGLNVRIPTLHLD